MGFESDSFPEAIQYYREAISLPMFQGLTNEQQNEVVKALKIALDVDGNS
jgi:dTDP-4-amino-4,6-dideoxygalactose transaminase